MRRAHFWVRNQTFSSRCVKSEMPVRHSRCSVSAVYLAQGQGRLPGCRYQFNCHQQRDGTEHLWADWDQLTSEYKEENMSGELNPESCPHLGITRKKRNWQKKKKLRRKGQWVGSKQRACSELRDNGVVPESPGSRTCARSSTREVIFTREFCI